MLGSIRKMQSELSRQMLNNEQQFVNYIMKKNKNVVFMSRLHDKAISDRNGEKLKILTERRTCGTMSVFYNIFDISIYIYFMDLNKSQLKNK